ncbi:PH and SEC7 domain-containing protein 2-like [Neoarius graeffei]|uniref:PH and SEC7 domain-containing protein 2-like n=1 Tax=Neoarius graeffei TaxID=443677 RepID=UPI00298BED20|nr:PH and SEC7 domain-containing protein 2-like [Neoarius graeffei]
MQPALNNWVTKLWNDYRKQEQVPAGATEQELYLFRRKRARYFEGRTLGYQLYHNKEFRTPETIRRLSKDLDLARETVNAYVTHFRFLSMCLDKALRAFLKVFWPQDEPEIQHLLLIHFAHRYLICTAQPLEFQPAVYALTAATIILNADLNSGHKGRKTTCEEFIAKMNRVSSVIQYTLSHLKIIYKSIKAKPLKAFKIKTRCLETNILENNLPATVFKRGNLICKRVMDGNGIKTKKGQRAWKPFTAILKGMVLHLEKDGSDSSKANSESAIRLHHALAYPVDHRNRHHVLGLETADYRLFHFQAESEAEQESWIAVINRIAACYSARALVSASHNMESRHLPVLPPYPTTMSLEQQLEHYKDQVQTLSEQMADCSKSFLWDGIFDYMEQEKKRYTTYVRVIQELISEDNPGEGSSSSN